MRPAASTACVYAYACAYVYAYELIVPSYIVRTQVRPDFEFWGGDFVLTKVTQLTALPVLIEYCSTQS